MLDSTDVEDFCKIWSGHVQVLWWTQTGHFMARVCQQNWLTDLHNETVETKVGQEAERRHNDRSLAKAEKVIFIQMGGATRVRTIKVGNETQVMNLRGDKSGGKTESVWKLKRWSTSLSPFLLVWVWMWNYKCNSWRRNSIQSQIKWFSI